MITRKAVKGRDGELPAAGELLAVEAIDQTGLIVTSEGASVRILRVTPPNPLLMSAPEREKTAAADLAAASRETLQIYIDARPMNLTQRGRPPAGCSRLGTGPALAATSRRQSAAVLCASISRASASRSARCPGRPPPDGDPHERRSPTRARPAPPLRSQRCGGVPQSRGSPTSPTQQSLEVNNGGCTQRLRSRCACAQTSRPQSRCPATWWCRTCPARASHARIATDSIVGARVESFATVVHGGCPREPFEQALRHQLELAGVKSPRELPARALQELTRGHRQPSSQGPSSTRPARAAPRADRRRACIPCRTASSSSSKRARACRHGRVGSSPGRVRRAASALSVARSALREPGLWRSAAPPRARVWPGPGARPRDPGERGCRGRSNRTRREAADHLPLADLQAAGFIATVARRGSMH